MGLSGADRYCLEASSGAGVLVKIDGFAIKDSVRGAYSSLKIGSAEQWTRRQRSDSVGKMRIRQRTDRSLDPVQGGGPRGIASKAATAAPGEGSWAR